MAAAERRKGERVTFERGFSAHMMGIDGTWRRDCTMEDVSETGAKLTVDGSVEGLHLKEFFLLLSSTGLAYRRCELAWVNGDQIGVIDGLRSTFGKTYAAEPDELIEQLKDDAAIQAADTLMLTIPSQLGVEFNLRVVETFATQVAPALGWVGTRG